MTLEQAGYLFSGFSIAFLWMTLLWVIHLIIRNAAIVDVGWGICLFLYAAVYVSSSPDLLPHEWLLLFVVGLWAIRLSSHLFIDRIYKKEEEGRYLYLREQWKTWIPFKFFLFYHAQTILNLILSIPFFLLAIDSEPNEIFIYLGASIALVGIFGESLADFQLKLFKSNPANKGGICRIGLWNYSRHPNYFFEFVYWIGIGFMGQAAQNGWLSWIAPILIFTTLYKVTGIPATERQALKSRGEAYRKYMDEVSQFIPLPKKIAKKSSS